MKEATILLNCETTILINLNCKSKYFEVFLRQMASKLRFSFVLYGWLFPLINKCLSHNEKWKPNAKVIADVCDRHLLPGLKNARDAATRLSETTC